MPLLKTHLEQIAYSSAAISDLPFPSPGIFTNALLRPHDITTLIRDTEAHERALFSVSPAAMPRSAPDPLSAATRRNTIFPSNGRETLTVAGINGLRAPRRNTAVATILGGDMIEQMRRAGGDSAYPASEQRERGEVDVNLLLTGAAKLCGIYPIAGAMERISLLKTRFEQLSSSIAHHEARVSKQAMQLDRINRPRDYDAEDDQMEENGEELLDESADSQEMAGITEDDLRREEDEIRELERKKRTLEERVNGMSRDLGGLLR